MKKLNVEALFGHEIKSLMSLVESINTKCYIVGGAVRDSLLENQRIKDVDLATSASIYNLKKLFQSKNIVFDDRAIKYGCLTVKIKGKSIQITSFRKDVETYGRSADINISDNILDDAKRRDFTINALYCSKDGVILDPLGNLDDVKVKMLKFIGDPERRIKEDYLRILRFFRFIAVLDLKISNIDMACLPIIKKHIYGLKFVSKERVVSELRKILLATSPTFCLKLLKEVRLYEKELGIFSDRALVKLESIERQCNCPISLVGRIVALEIRKPGFLMSKKEKKYHKELKDLFKLDKSLGYVGYKLGKIKGMDYIMINAVRKNKSVQPQEIIAIDNGCKNTFPINFNDIYLRTKNVKKSKEQFENIKGCWIDSDFKLSKEQLLSLIS
ncbi:hypothetical protein OA005_00265 [Paracoccaceae bacterium]|nr:hypothetical protein [Paracoccaceae bacterium]